LWRIDPANPELLVLDGEFSLATAGFLFWGFPLSAQSQAGR
jgi:hypothetical protein